jgi:hypothetical protein
MVLEGCASENAEVAEASCEVDVSIGGEVVGAEMGKETGCALVVEVLDGSGDSVAKIEDGPTGIIAFAPSFCPSLPAAPPCWLASVELVNGEAILTQVYYILEVMIERWYRTSAPQMAIVAVKRNKPWTSQSEEGKKRETVAEATDRGQKDEAVEGLEGVAAIVLKTTVVMSAVDGC